MVGILIFGAMAFVAYKNRVAVLANLRRMLPFILTALVASAISIAGSVLILGPDITMARAQADQLFKLVEEHGTPYEKALAAGGRAMPVRVRSPEGDEYEVDGDGRIKAVAPAR
jgi:hypothetical protein